MNRTLAHGAIFMIAAAIFLALFFYPVNQQTVTENLYALAYWGGVLLSLGALVFLCVSSKPWRSVFLMSMGVVFVTLSIACVTPSAMWITMLVLSVIVACATRLKARKEEHKNPSTSRRCHEDLR